MKSLPSESEYRVLVALTSSPGTASSVTKSVSLSRHTVNTALSRMVLLGWVRSSEKPRRLSDGYRITRTGRSVLVRARKRYRELLELS
jgi:DNA-binding IclR family transcriptional regulator